VPNAKVIPHVVLRARAGDPKACRELYDANVDRVYGFCLAFCRGDRERAADLSQETFVRAFRALSSLEDPVAFPAWLISIARRCCLRHADATARERAALSRFALEPTNEPSRPDAPRLRPDEVTRLGREILAQCPDEALRETATLFYGDPPHSTREIADRLGISETAVTTRLSRFRDQARRRLLARLARSLEDLP
jgi:RNA polymerase sigma-70 factor (ECF subfamily)